MRLRDAILVVTVGAVVLFAGGTATAQKPTEQEFVFSGPNLAKLRDRLKDYKFADEKLRAVFSPDAKDIEAIILRVTRDPKGTVTAIRVSKVDRNSQKVDLVKTLDQPDNSDFQQIKSAMEK
jgi:hypothetical protein